MNCGKEILEYVRDHPGCDLEQLIEGVGSPTAASEAHRMVLLNELDRWFHELIPHYYLPGAYKPRYHGGDE